MGHIKSRWFFGRCKDHPFRDVEIKLVPSYITIGLHLGDGKAVPLADRVWRVWGFDMHPRVLLSDDSTCKRRAMR